MSLWDLPLRQAKAQSIGSTLNVIFYLMILWDKREIVFYVLVLFDGHMIYPFRKHEIECEISYEADDNHNDPFAAVKVQIILYFRAYFFFYCIHSSNSLIDINMVISFSSFFAVPEPPL